MESNGDEKTMEHPIEQVRLTIPTTDDPTIPAFTFRTFILGSISCVFLAFVDNFFTFRQNPLSVQVILPQILALPAGKLMAAMLPAKTVGIPGTTLRFSLNPGPFNMKEHVLITVFASAGASINLATLTIAAMKAYYHRPIQPLPVLLLIQTTQILGYGFAGLAMKLLVNSPYMWWPTALPDVTFYRTLHEKEVRAKGQQTRLQFFFMIFVVSFAYYVVPNFFFPSITALSFVCWIWKDSIKAQQLGSGLYGLGLGSIGFDWATVTAYTGSPLLYPASAIFNTMAGFCIFMYVIVPVAYWSNANHAQRFPFMSSQLFDDHGQEYNISRALNEKEFSFDEQGYENYSKLYFSIASAYSFGFMFASLTSSISHVALFHGSSLWSQVKKAYKEEGAMDIHQKMMQEYESVPQWWFLTLLVSVLGISIATCEGFGKQLQLPYWGVLLAVALVLIFLFPFGILAATTGQSPNLSVITELLMGYIYPGRPLANVTFKSYGFSSMGVALDFLYGFKLGQYMKIPPKSMFVAQVIGMLISSTVSFGVTWWLFTSVKNICQPDSLPKGSPWTCPVGKIFYATTAVWGVIGPSRIFYPSGEYSYLFHFFWIGAAAPLVHWFVIKLFPGKKWIRSINFPMIFIGGQMVPPGGPVNIWAWFVIGVLFNFVIYYKFREWWSRYNYVVSISLDIGVAAMALVASVALQMNGVYGVNWWGIEVSDHCPLAICPTEPGIQVEGCPAIQI